MLPREVTLAVVEEELVAARAWAQRNGVLLEWHPDSMHLRASLVHPKSQERFFLLGEVDAYKAQPPAWVFCDGGWSNAGEKRHWPKSGGVPGVSGNFFIDHQGRPAICAAFNRLAYSKHGGPHSDWGPDTTGWLKAAPGYAHAEVLGEMLDHIARHFNYSSGRMG